MCMGGGGNSNSAESKRNREIERQLRQDEKKLEKEVKLLLLGAGESGKSTILKQMKLIHASGFSKSDRDDYKVIIFQNLLSSLKSIREHMDGYGLTYENPENAQHDQLIMIDRELARGESFPGQYFSAFASLWRDSGVQKVVERGNEFALHDNLFYFFRDLDRLFTPDYTPSDQDILRSRLKTTGITETVFDLGTLTYRMFDVGGQRSERKKWIHCFENVTALLFLVAISGYDQCLVEDKDANQMQEALMLFESIVNSQWFVSTSVILFLNKIDLFKEKLRHTPVRKYFPEYSGPDTSYDHSYSYFQDSFNRLNRNPKKIYIHPTNATDTNLLKITMASVQDIVLQKNLETLVL
ncbi:guanine nucleotide binding protein, alpha subunit [Ascodesmis nigricans]|uniref:Guanine nucleotide binding protein, alpha subunit n=1 Tax=Ascodesmis nigricans TaxID=341454 RepID=A0A4S2MY76_9PEZI|nr:guanine nucleotide binding protein, alpha subunit [Ascodesmis nigricans]